MKNKNEETIAVYDICSHLQGEQEYRLNEGLLENFYPIVSGQTIPNGEVYIKVDRLFRNCGGDPKKFQTLAEHHNVWSEIETLAEADEGDLDWYAEDFFMSIQEWISNNPGPYIVKGTRMGWQSRSGHTIFDTDDAKEFFNKITPNTGDLTFRMWKELDTDKVVASISHHDAPMGEGREFLTLDGVLNELTYRQLLSYIRDNKEDMNETYTPDSKKRDGIQKYVKEYVDETDDFESLCEKLVA